MPFPSPSSWYSDHNRRALLLLSFSLVAVIAAADWLLVPNVGIGFLYLISIILASGFLPRWQVVLMALGCALLREFLSPFPQTVESLPRTTNVFIGFVAVGLMVHEMARNRRMTVEHHRDIEERDSLQRQTEQQLRVLIETSPAAIFVLDAGGQVLIANEAATQLTANPDIVGQPIHEYLPAVGQAVAAKGEQKLRTAIESQGKRANGEVFVAHTWLSTFHTSNGWRTAAIVLDGSEELRDRQEQGLRRLMDSSRILVGAVSHEIRNLCGAVAVSHANLARHDGLRNNADFRALGTLIDALRKLASAELRPRAEQRVPEVKLEDVLYELRVLIERTLHEAEIALHWECNAQGAAVRVDPQILLQVVLNLSQNAIRALKNVERAQVMVYLEQNNEICTLVFIDNGPGVPKPDDLFHPFQRGAEVTGLGLYLSRAMLRSVGGNLRYERERGLTRFLVDLPLAVRNQIPATPTTVTKA